MKYVISNKHIIKTLVIIFSFLFLYSANAQTPILVDIGLRTKTPSQTMTVMVEPPEALKSPLRIKKDGKNYGIPLDGSNPIKMGGVTFSEDWTAVGPSSKWVSIAVSADGKYQTALEKFGRIYTSDDFGQNWTLRDISIIPGSKYWGNVDMSADGKYQTAHTVCDPSGSTATIDLPRLYRSENFGVTWYATGNPMDVTDVFMSDTGQYQTATTRYTCISGLFGGSGTIYKSKNYGASWVKRDIVRNWLTGDMSSSGQYQYANVNGVIYLSQDYGEKWAMRGISYGIGNGFKMSNSSVYAGPSVITSNGQYILNSQNYGQSFMAKTPATDIGLNFTGTAISRNGSVQAGTSQYGGIFVSENSGGSWKKYGPIKPGIEFIDIAMSSDGTYMTAVTIDGHIYINHPIITTYEVK